MVWTIFYSLLDSFPVESEQMDKKDENMTDTASMVTTTSKAVLSTPRPG